jgi:NADH:ubiquinone oxidoreductase subunit D
VTVKIIRTSLSELECVNLHLVRISCFASSLYHIADEDGHALSTPLRKVL